MGSEANLLTGPDKPFRGVVLVPFDRVPVVHRKLVMEVVVTLTNGDKGSEHMVTGGMLVIERCFSEPVGKRVNAEGGL